MKRTINEVRRDARRYSRGQTIYICFVPVLSNYVYGTVVIGEKVAEYRNGILVWEK